MSRCRLSTEQIHQIRLERQAGATQQSLATKFGVSQSYICMVVSGRARVNAGGPVEAPRKYSRKDTVDAA